MKHLGINLPLSRLIASLAILTILLQISSSAQTNAQKKDETQDQDVIKLEASLVTFNVSVVDSAGRPVFNLKETDFTVAEDGVEQKIAFFSTVEEPFSLVLLIDISGSTADQIDLMRTAARNFISQMRPGDRIALIAFGREAELIEDFTSDRKKLDEAISRIEPAPRSQASTAFYDALQLMTEELLNKIKGRKAFIALTDGVDSSSHYSYETVGPTIEKSGAVAYFIEVDTEDFSLAGVIKPRADPSRIEFSPQQLKKYADVYIGGEEAARYRDHFNLSPLERREVNKGIYQLAREELREMAERTGGRVYPVKQLQQIGGAYKEIADELRMQYSIGYYPSNTARDGKWREIKIDVKRSGATAHTRPGYYAPKD